MEIIIKDKIKNLMEILIYKRDYHESVWGKINTKR